MTSILQGYAGRQLGQLRPANTTAVSLYTPSKLGVVDEILICNTTSAATTFRLFIDIDSDTFDQTTAIFYDAPLAANETVSWEPSNAQGVLLNSTSNIGVRTGTNNAITFTAYGREKDV